MKHLLYISVLLIVSCGEQKSNSGTQEYAFNNIGDNEYNYETETKTEKTKESVKTIESVKPKKKVDSTQEISIEAQKVFSYNKNVSENFYHKHHKYRYRPSSKFDHIEHIRKNSRIGSTDGMAHDPKFFVDYIIENNLEKTEYKKYITDRKLLKPITVNKCDSNYILLSDIQINNNTYEIELYANKFIEEQHEVKFRKNNNDYQDYESIDGKFPYGGLYGKINRELSLIKFKANNNHIKVNMEAIPSINEPKFCDRSILGNGIEAYQDDENIYVYISGGNAADTYFGKLVFNQTGFVTSIMVDYVPMSRYGCFGDDYLGF